MILGVAMRRATVYLAGVVEGFETDCPEVVETLAGCIVVGPRCPHISLRKSSQHMPLNFCTIGSADMRPRLRSAVRPSIAVCRAHCSRLSPSSPGKRPSMVARSSLRNDVDPMWPCP